MLLLVFLYYFFATVKSQCASEWATFPNNDACLLAVNKSEYYFHAVRVCDQHKAMVVKIENVMDNGFVNLILTYETNFTIAPWIGVEKSPDGKWIYADGSKLDYTTWAAGEPKNSTSSICAVMQLSGSKWESVDCTDPRPFFCSMKIPTTTTKHTSTHHTTTPHHTTSTLHSTSSHPSSTTHLTTTTPGTVPSNPTIGTTPTPSSLPCLPAYYQAIDTCQQGWQYSPQTGYQYYVLYDINFDDADVLCKGMDANLTSVHSAAENDFITSLCCPSGNFSYNVDGRYGGYLTGGKLTNGAFTWSDGTPFDYFGKICFDLKQPSEQLIIMNYVGIESCGLAGPGGWLWDYSVHFSLKQTYAVCKKTTCTPN